MSKASWRVAKCLGPTGKSGLLGEINKTSPSRNKRSDGGIGDPNHSSRKSDHNPCSCHRVVCARDFTHDPDNGFDAEELARYLQNRILQKLEGRVKYVIWKRRIMSGLGQKNPAGVWRSYSGVNPHTAHIHVSIRHPEYIFDSTKSWGWAERQAKQPERSSYKEVEEASPAKKSV
jgi:hypothetical protein